MTDERDGVEQNSDRRAAGDVVAERARRPYARPELIEYGTVAKLTQTGGVTVADFSGMRRMCL